MQLRIRNKTPASFSSRKSNKYIIKIISLVLVIFAVIFFLDRLEISAPKKSIKQEISNEKLIKLK